MNPQQGRQIAVFFAMTCALAAVALNGVLPSHPLSDVVQGGWSKLAAGAQDVVSSSDRGGILVKEQAPAQPTVSPQTVAADPTSGSDGTGAEPSGSSTSSGTTAVSAPPGPENTQQSGGTHGPGGKHPAAPGGQHAGSHSGQGHSGQAQSGQTHGETHGGQAHGGQAHGGQAHGGQVSVQGSKSGSGTTVALSGSSSYQETDATPSHAGHGDRYGHTRGHGAGHAHQQSHGPRHHGHHGHHGHGHKHHRR